MLVSWEPMSNFHWFLRSFIRTYLVLPGPFFRYQVGKGCFKMSDYRGMNGTGGESK